MNPRAWIALGCLLLGLGGCAPQPLPRATATEPGAPALGGAFDATDTGTLQVSVRWDGPRPALGTFREVSISPQVGWVHRDVPNPYLPRIGPDGGLKDCVIRIEGVEPAKSRPWDHPVPRVRLGGTGIEIESAPSNRIGLMRQGGVLEVESDPTLFRSLRLRGAHFATLMFPEGSTPRRRTLQQPGWVELSNANGLFAIRASLWVTPDPYVAVSDEGGRVRIPQVPAGNYIILAWLANPRVLQAERDPETGLQVRQRYAPPVEIRRPVTIHPGQTTPLEVRFTPADLGGGSE